MEVEVGEGGMNQECLIKARKSTRVGFRVCLIKARKSTRVGIPSTRVGIPSTRVGIPSTRVCTVMCCSPLQTGIQKYFLSIILPSESN